MRLDVANEVIKYRGDFWMINKSELARRFGCDRRTVSNYMNEKTINRKPRKVHKLIEGYEDLIEQKIDMGATITAVYKFITNEKGFKGSYQTVYNYSKIYKDNSTKKATIRFETKPGLQGQVDWKENLKMINRSGDVFEINIFLMVLGYSRKKFLKLTSDRTQKTLFKSMTEAFEYLGGIPKEILFDNMSTVVDRSKTTYRNTSINKSFKQFSKDAGFEVVTCRAYRPQTKGKVEALARLTNRLNPYNGEFETFEELEMIVKKLNNDLNNEISKATYEIPNERFKKEKEYLNPLNSIDILKSYFFQEKAYKVSKESMINYQGKKYSVPIRYISELVTVKESSTDICIYYNGDLLTCHNKNNSIFHYKDTHVIDILKSDALSHYSDDDISEFIENNLKNMDIFLEVEEK